MKVMIRQSRPDSASMRKAQVDLERRRPAIQVQTHVVQTAGSPRSGSAREEGVERRPGRRAGDGARPRLQ